MKDTMHIIVRDSGDYSARLRLLADAPAQLYTRGGPLKPLLARPCVAIVGSRKVTAYGKAVTTQLARELARRGVCVVSGLAIGVDGLAHKAALEVGGATIAVLPCGLERVYPAGHRELAARIVASGGAIVSEYPPGSVAYKLNFVARNRIVAALANAVLITEAAPKSGTLHTARFALEQGKEVLAVPGNITSEMSAGTNNLIKAGATPVTSIADALRAVGLQPEAARPTPKGTTAEEQLILNFLSNGVHDGAELLAATGLDAAAFNRHLTMLEISGAVRALGANRWAVI